MTRVGKLEGSGIRNNLELKEYIDNARRIESDLYFELHMAAEVIQSNLSRVKGVTNRLRARIIGSALHSVADLHKTATSGLAKVWVLFERHFNAELEAAPSRKAAKVDKFHFE